MNRPWLPRLPRLIVPRPRLYRLLDNWAPVSVVRGAQGYGKTTLVTAWLSTQARADITPIWVRADATMRELEPFERHLALSMSAAGLDSASPRGRRPRSQALGRLNDVLLASAPTAKIVLVIDEARHLRAQPVLNTLIGLVQRHRQLHLIICSRGAHPIELLASAVVEVNPIAAPQLLFELAEMRELALILGKPLSEDDLRRLHSATGGWPSVLRLILDAMTDGELPLAAAEQYLRATVLQAVQDSPAGDQTRFSLADRLDTRMIGDLYGDESLEEIVEALELPGLLQREYQGDAVVLSYPSLVKDLLSASYTARDPAAAQELHRRLAFWYFTHAGESHTAMALRHACAGQEWALVDQIWAAHGPSLSMTHSETLRQALAGVPASILDTHPGMRIGLATLTVLDCDEDSGRSATLRAYTEGSRRAIEQQSCVLSLPELVYLGTGKLMSLRLAGRFRESADFATALAERIAQDPNVKPPVERLAELHLQTAITHTLAGDDHDAVRAYQLAWEFASQSAAEFVAAHAAANLALTYALRGEIAEAQSWLTRYHQFDLTDQWAEYLVGVGALIAHGLIALDRLEQGAVQVVLEQLALSPSVELWPFVMYLRCQYALHFGEPVNVLGQLAINQRDRERDLHNKGAAAALLTRCRVELLTARNQGERARLVAAGAGAALAVPTTRLHLFNSEYPNARRLAAQHLFDESTPLRDQLELLLLKAAAAQRMGDTFGADEDFKQALEIFEQTGILRVFAGIARADLMQLVFRASGQFSIEDALTLARARAVYPDQMTLVTLTKSERALVLAMQQSASRREVAETLFVSLNTVKTQMQRLFQKLGTTTREETLMRIGELGLLV